MVVETLHTFWSSFSLSTGCPVLVGNRRERPEVAQLETIVELQQVEIHNLNEWKNKHMQNEHNVSSNTSAIEVQAKEEEKKRTLSYSKPDLLTFTS